MSVEAKDGDASRAGFTMFKVFTASFAADPACSAMILPLGSV